MEADRGLSFLIPPFVFLGSLLVGKVFEPCSNFLARLELTKIENLLPLVSGLGFSIIPLGFLLTSFSIAILNLIGLVSKTKRYEALFRKDHLKRIWRLLNLRGKPESRVGLYACAVFDYEHLPKETHEWCLRRWNSAMVSIHSFVALSLSLVPGKCVFSIDYNAWHWILSAFIIVCLLCNIICAWQDTVNMLDFKSKSCRGYVHTVRPCILKKLRSFFRKLFSILRGYFSGKKVQEHGIQRRYRKEDR